MRVCLLTLLAPLAASCADGSSELLVTVGATGTLTGIADLRATAVNAGQTSSPVSFPLASPITIPPEQTFSLRFDSTRKGTVTLTVDALDTTGKLLASATATGDVEPSKTSEVRVTLAGSVPTDMAANTDAGVSDGIVPEDLSPAPDLAPVPRTLSFGMPVTSPAAMNLSGLAIGDFNKDKKLDIAVVANTANEVQVMLGNGDGSFQAGVGYAVGTSPAGVVAGDLNGDGNPDLLVANGGTNSITVLLGTPNGVFGGSKVYATGMSIAGIAIGKFNADNFVDVVAGDPTSGQVNVLLGVGDGTLQSGTSFAAGPGAAGIALGDFNSDGRTDLAVTNNNSSISVLSGKGDGTFAVTTSHAVGSAPAAIIASDLDGDTRPDVVTGNFGSKDATVLLNDGKGGFVSSTLTTAVATNSIATADFNTDGKVDLAAAGFGTVDIFLGTGGGAFSAAIPFVAGGGAHGVRVADFNGDGLLDVVVANGTNSVTVLLNTSQ